MITDRQLREYIEGRGYRATPVTNTIAAASGAPLEVVGYDLRGPRGNKHFVGKESDGCFRIESAKLWADGVDYATAKLAKRK